MIRHTYSSITKLEYDSQLALQHSLVPRVMLVVLVVIQEIILFFIKQGCPLSPTLFGLYIDEVSHYICHREIQGFEACLAGIAIQILLYADDIVLISDSQ